MARNKKACPVLSVRPQAVRREDVSAIDVSSSSSPPQELPQQYEYPEALDLSPNTSPTNIEQVESELEEPAAKSAKGTSSQASAPKEEGRQDILELRYRGSTLSSSS